MACAIAGGYWEYLLFRRNAGNKRMVWAHYRCSLNLGKKR